MALATSCRPRALPLKKPTVELPLLEALFVGSLGNVLLSRNPAVQVPLALEGLTVVFEMGTRGSPPPSLPNDEEALLLQN